MQYGFLSDENNTHTQSGSNAKVMSPPVQNPGILSYLYSSISKVAEPPFLYFTSGSYNITWSIQRWGGGVSPPSSSTFCPTYSNPISLLAAPSRFCHNMESHTAFGASAFTWLSNPLDCSLIPGSLLHAN